MSNPLKKVNSGSIRYLIVLLLLVTVVLHTRRWTELPVSEVKLAALVLVSALTIEAFVWSSRRIRWFPWLVAALIGTGAGLLAAVLFIPWFEPVRAAGTIEFIQHFLTLLTQFLSGWHQFLLALRVGYVNSIPASVMYTAVLSVAAAWFWLLRERVVHRDDVFSLLMAGAVLYGLMWSTGASLAYDWFFIYLLLVAVLWSVQNADRSFLVTTGLVLALVLAGVTALPLAQPARDLAGISPWFQTTFPALTAATQNQPASADRFSLKQVGFTEDDRQLGGPIAAGEGMALSLKLWSPVLPQTLYLRGTAKQTYTGSGWLNPQTRLEPFPPDRAFGQNDVWSPAVSRYQLVLEIQHNRSLQTQTLFHSLVTEQISAAPATVSHRNGDRMAFLRDPESNLVLSQPQDNEQPNPFSYRTVAAVPVYYREQIERLTRSRNTWDTVPDRYLQLPTAFPERVARLAHQTAGDGSPFEQAKAIESYLRSHYAYATDLPPTPAGRDFVDHFLFETGRGYCVYHATAMTTMLRTLGIPARWVSGFAVDLAGAEAVARSVPSQLVQQLEGDPIPASMLEEAGFFSNHRPVSIQVPNAGAHAWVEAYFPGYGWVSFDPTPRFGGFAHLNTPTGDTPPDANRETSDSSTGDPAAQQDEPGQPQNREQPPDPVQNPVPGSAGPGNGPTPGLDWQQLLTTASLIVLVTLVLRVCWIVWKDQPLGKTPQARIIHLYQRSLVLLSKMGLGRSLGTTPAEHARLVQTHLPNDAAAAFAVLAARAEQALYDPQAGAAKLSTEVEQCTRAWHQFKRGLSKDQGRVHYFLNRISPFATGRAVEQTLKVRKPAR